MRIAVLCTDLGIKVPGDKGASLHLAAISRAFADAGHDVLLIAVAGHGDPPAGVSHHLLAHPGRSTGLRRELRKLRFVRRAPGAVAATIARFAPEVIYERLSLFGTAGVRLSQATGAHHVVEVNALLAREEAQWRGLRLGAVARRREREVLAHAVVRVGVSEEVAGQIDEVAPGGRTVVVANGVDLDVFADRPDRSAARRRWGLADDAPLAVFVGALRPWHGLDVAIRALAATAGPLRLVVAGDGPVASELRGLAGVLGVADRIDWLGHVEHRDIPAVLAAADVALAPYPDLATFSFSPLKLYEYLAAGTPVIASRIGQIPRILADGRFGTLVPAGSTDELAAALTRLIAEPEAALDRAAEGRAHAFAELGWTRRAEEIIDHLRRATGDAAIAPTTTGAFPDALAQ